MSFWKNKRILVTGGSGFIGSHLVEELLEKGSRVRVADRSEERFLDYLGSRRKEVEFLPGDLRDYDFCRQACRGMEYVLHLAAKVGGVGYNVNHPAEMFHENVVMNAQVMEAAARNGVERYLCMSSACVYPRSSTVPTPEAEGFLGDPEESNLGYGWSKRVAEVQARCYARQYPMKIAIARPYNAYGPRDNFAWETSHVIPALIRKVVEKQNPVVVWGNGEQSRAFLYIADLVRGLLLALEKYAQAAPVNIGTDEEIKIKDLVSLIAKISGENPRIVFDRSKPSGQPRRNADISRAREVLGYQPRIFLPQGLKRTIDWYRMTRSSLDK